MGSTNGRLLRALLVLTGCLLAAGVASAQDATYMQIPGIPGESMDQGHEGWIDVYGLDHDLILSYDQGGGPRTGAPSLTDIAILKGSDKATVKLIQASLEDNPLDPVVIEVCRQAQQPECYYRLELERAKVSAISLAGSCAEPAGCSPSQTESVTFVYEKITWIYTEFRGGNPEAPIVYCWDLNQNQSCG